MSSPTVAAAPPTSETGGAGDSSTNGRRPSDARRKRLNEQLSVPMVSNFFSIERYYDAADKVFESFRTAFAAKQWDTAYLYGKRYCTFCVDAIPTHNYFKADKYKHLQYKHRPQVDLVLKQLSDVAEHMDVEELEKQAIAAEKALKEAEERARQEREQFEALTKRASQFTTSTTSTTPTFKTSQQSLEASALSKLDLLRNAMSQEQMQKQKQQLQRKRTTSTTTGSGDMDDDEYDELTLKRDPSGEEPGIPSSRYRLLSDSEDDDNDDEKKSSRLNGMPVVLPPPILPPSSTAGPGSAAAAAPPPYHQVVASHRNGRSQPQNGIPPQKHLTFLSEPKAKRRERVPVRKLQDEYRNAYLHAMHDGKIEVMGIDTYQGKNPRSTNGCTVISALVAARHLSSGKETSPISDTSVVDVIDRQCGPILEKIRGKLGLGPSALIIPSDVHDHLVDAKILRQECFEGAAGGNVMDPKHMGEFLKLLAVGNDGKGALRKAAATFFFHEHVVSIVKVSSNNGVAYYDLVDSLPGLNTGGRSKATRTRCEGIDALAILLRWYTTRKFSDANCTHIDRNAWDDAMADFDPRVFQGFVWSNRDKQ